MISFFLTVAHAAAGAVLKTPHLTYRAAICS